MKGSTGRAKLGRLALEVHRLHAKISRGTPLASAAIRALAFSGPSVAVDATVVAIAVADAPMAAVDAPMAAAGAPIAAVAPSPAARVSDADPAAPSPTLGIRGARLVPRGAP